VKQIIFNKNMGKNKCSNKELKTQIEQLESMVQKLKGEVKKNGNSVYKFTEEQMIDFVSSLHTKFMDNMGEQLLDYGFDEGIVSIEVENLTIVPTIDNDVLVDEILGNVSCPDEDEMMDIVSDVLNDLGIEQPEEIEE
jgi:hypothetical protein